MAIEPAANPSQPAAYRLARFQPDHAPLIATWVADPLDAFRIAPRTRPPITAQIIREWGGAGHRQRVLLGAAGAPVAYGEINALDAGVGRYWLGHLIVDPARRGEGLGVCLTRALIDHAFTCCAAQRVVLVVLPSNTPAVRCYRAAGMLADGHEVHYFAAYGRRERLIRFAMSANAWRRANQYI